VVVVVLAAPAVPVVAVPVVAGVVVVEVEVEDVEAVVGVPVVVAAPGLAGWSVTNCSRAVSKAENSLPTPPSAAPVVAVVESMVVVAALLSDVWVGLSKDERVVVGVVPEIAFVDIILSLFELTRQKGVGAARKTFSRFCEESH
jgi:hypothetical protein